MMPGDTVTDDVVVENDGTGQLRYAMTTASTNADEGAARRAHAHGQDDRRDHAGTPCDNFDGTSVLAATVLGASTAAFGDPAAGAQAATAS